MDRLESAYKLYGDFDVVLIWTSSESRSDVQQLKDTRTLVTRGRRLVHRAFDRNVYRKSSRRCTMMIEIPNFDVVAVKLARMFKCK